MVLYAETTSRRVRQVLLDIGVLVWMFAFVRIGEWVRGLVLRLAEPGQVLQDGGREFSDTVGRAGEVVDDLPLVGDRLREPFESVVEGGRVLEAAGARQQEVVGDLAVALGLLLALLPIAYVLFRYLPSRVRWVREATAARHLRSTDPDLQLFALRALANRPLADLRRVAGPNPTAAYAAGDYEPLARLELTSLGLVAAGSRSIRAGG